jgi:hypothetical protein
MSDEVVWSGNVVGGLALVFSNIALLPAIFLATRRGYVVLGFLLLRTFVASTFYHACQGGFVCLMSYDMHVRSDYFAVYDGIVFVITSLPFRPLQNAAESQKHFLLYVLLFTPLIYFILAGTPFYILPLFGILAPFVIAGVYGYLRGVRLFRRRGGVWLAVAAGLAFAIGGALMFFVPDTYYYTAHSLWHVFSMIGAYLLILARCNSVLVKRCRLGGQSDLKESADTS